jgi:1-acyl-sn-glycerol-3-phosphate acyltransferase
MNTSRKKLIFHYMLSFACRVIVFGSVNIRKTIRNQSGVKLREACVVVCNHQSHLDTVVNILQQPRMILLTHSWVQKSMFFGWFVRSADFLSVDEGVMPIMDKLREIAENGYSIFVFPEGTRSYDLEIGRFHQGAFLIARELNLDILPVISYGSGNAMPKFEPFLKTSPVSMTTLERIPPDSPLIKDTTLATSKSIRQHMKNEYSRIRKEFETPAFFRKKVTRNYLFRGPVLEWYIKVKIRMEKHYQLFHSILPEKGLISDIGCGYGFMAYMLQLMAPGRRIIGYDHDHDKIATANQCNLKNKRTTFIRTDVTGFEPESSDAFILADVLHYLTEAEQEKLIVSISQKLAPGGVIIIRDADADMRKKHLGTRISEFMSTRIGFNKTGTAANKLYFMPKQFYLAIFERLNLDVEVIDDTKLTSNLVYVLRKRP